jgi:hypothetical protein
VIILAYFLLFSSFHNQFLFKLSHFWSNLAYLYTLGSTKRPAEPFILICGQQRHFHFNMRPAETFSFSMRPMYSFEFETPALGHDIIYEWPSTIVEFVFGRDPFWLMLTIFLSFVVETWDKVLSMTYLIFWKNEVELSSITFNFWEFIICKLFGIKIFVGYSSLFVHYSRVFVITEFDCTSFWP